MSDDLRTQIDAQALRDPNGDPYPTYKHDLWMLNRILPLVEQAIQQTSRIPSAWAEKLDALQSALAEKDAQIAALQQRVDDLWDARRETPAPPQEPT